MDEAQIKHLAIVLSNINDATVDWAKVAEIREISRKDNAVTAFKAMMKKIGLEYANNKFTYDGSAVPSTPGEKKAKATPRKRKSKADGEETETKSESVSPKKKQKAKKEVEVVIKVDEEADGDDGEQD